MQPTLSGTTLRFVADGNLTADHATPTKRELVAILNQHSSARTCSLHLANVHHVDSTGLSFIFGVYSECKRRGIAFAVEEPTPAVCQLFALLKISDHFGLANPPAPSIAATALLAPAQSVKNPVDMIK